ncbi:MAG: cupin domain-containing protein [Candidatus Latescibacteria bacterium]|nr:cupin domain-containing protein [Candidatus Latescibacterota bacterium]
MIAAAERYVIRSQNANQIYWEQGVYPAWTRLSAFRSIPGQKQGAGVEPHYHDNDELWLFLSGQGEVWLDGQSHPITPGTAIYTPMGAVHRFQMFTDFDNVAIVTPLERQQRPVHLRVEEAGPPQRTVPGFVIPGAANTGPFDPGPRCPLREFRAVELAPGQSVVTGVLDTNENWIVLEGALHLQVEQLEVELGPHDLALLRAGAQRHLSTPSGVRLVLAREVAHV